MSECRTCVHLIVEPDKAGRRVVRKQQAYRCGAPVPDILPLLPHSITKAYGWAAPSDRSKRWVCPDDGRGCPLYTALSL